MQEIPKMKKRIVNPETLTPHIGHHLSAHGYADKADSRHEREGDEDGQLTVTSTDFSQRIQT
jgi:hypothetical protein